MTFHTCKLFKSLQAYRLMANRNDCEFTQLHVYSTLLRNNNPGDRVREITLTFRAHGEIVCDYAKTHKFFALPTRRCDKSDDVSSFVADQSTPNSRRL